MACSGKTKDEWQSENRDCIVTLFSFSFKTPPTTERFGQAATMEGIGAIGGTPPAFNRPAPGADFAPNKRRRY